MDLFGKSIDGNEIREIIASGGMATVYKAINSSLEVPRAIKILHPEALEESQRLLTEAKISAHLHSPYIVQCHHVGTYEGYPYIEMEYVDGKDLYYLLSERGRLDCITALCVTIAVCRALKVAHSTEYMLYGEKRSGIVHRDIKPANILIAKSGQVKLTDFGIAKVKTLDIHTRTTSIIVGSSYYLSPEQLNCEELDPRTDIYAVGCVLYEMLTGRPMFPYDNVGDLCVYKHEKEYDREALKEYPPDIAKLIDTCVEVNKEDRIQGADELERICTSRLKENGIHSIEDRIHSWLEGKVDKSEVLKTGAKKAGRQRRYLLATAGVLLILILVGLTSVLKNSPQKEFPKEAIAETVQETKPKIVQDSVTIDEVVRSEEQMVFQKEDSVRTVLVAEESNTRSSSIAVPHAVDLLSLFKAKKYRECVEKSKAMDSSNDTVFLIKVGSYLALNEKTEVERLIFSREINNGYLSFCKGVYFLKNGNANPAEKNFLSAKMQPSLIDIQKEASEKLILIARMKYEKSPNAENRSALEHRKKNYLDDYCKGGGGQFCSDLLQGL